MMTRLLWQLLNRYGWFGLGLWGLGAAATVYGVVEWFRGESPVLLLVVIAIQLSLLYWEGRRTLAKREADLKQLRAAVASMADAQAHKKVRHPVRRMSYKIRGNGTTENRHYIEALGVDEEIYWIEFLAGGDPLNGRVVKFTVEDQSGARLPYTLTWGQGPGANGKTLDHGVLRVHFPEPIPAGVATGFTVRYVWPRQNPELKRWQHCPIGFSPSCPTDRWEAEVLICKRLRRRLKLDDQTPLVHRTVRLPKTTEFEQGEGPDGCWRLAWVTADLKPHPSGYIVQVHPPTREPTGWRALPGLRSLNRFSVA